MANLPTDVFDAVVAQLIPFMGTKDERQAELIPALSGKPIISRIEWEGTPRAFTVKLVNLLAQDELIVVLRRLPVGPDKHAEIESLCKKIDVKPLQKLGGESDASGANQVAAIDRVKLRDALTTAFGKEELELLCADIQQELANAGIDLPVNLDMIGGSTTLSLITQNLISYLDRRGYLTYLIAAVRRARPKLVI